VDVRLVAATNVNLVEKIREGKFREDLYYRLNVVPIAAPPLRERLEDIALLAHHFVEKVCRQEEIPIRRLSPETISRLQSFAWPGNVRQLENLVEMAVALSGTREILYPSDFPLPAQSTYRMQLQTAAILTNDFEQTVGRIERQILEEALKKAHGNKTAAAGMLGLKRTTLAAKLKSLEAVA
jgi:DNA-binding NtrC family response regulator